MKLLRLLTTSAAALLVAAGGHPTDDGELSYRVVSVKRKLQRVAPAPEQRLAAGDALVAGDVLRTGWWSSAEIAAVEAAASFHLDSRTRVRLARGTPGVLIEVAEGRVRAVFEPLLRAVSADGEGPRERIVTTPSAILAVRGTEYGVTVDGSGDTTVVVLEGTVEVLDIDRRAEPVLVEAGHACRVRRGQPPESPYRHGVSRDQWDRGARPETGQHGQRDQQPGGMSQPGRGMGSGGNRRGGGGSGGHGG